MKNWKNYLVPSLFALAGVGFLIPAVKSVIKGVPLTYDSLWDFDNYGSLAFAFMFFTFAVVFGRKSGGGSGPPSA
jgi:hypothetical protein